jgi:hypothetical protein
MNPVAIFPSQTSLIPIQVALARFLEQGGNIFGNYPYWYLGTTPFYYLTGPVLPLVLVGLHRILPFFNLFEVFFLVIGVCWLMGGVGVYLLIREIREDEGKLGKMRDEKIAFLAAIFYVFGPMVPLFFRFSDGLYLAAFSFLPFVLLVYLKLFKKWDRKLAVLLTGLLTWEVLLDSLIIPTLVLGMAVIFLVQVGWKRAEEKLKQTFLIFAFSILLSTLWYTPGYWLTLLGAPSLAGKGLFWVIGELIKLLPPALALVLAVVSVKFFKGKNGLRDFCFYWLFTYVFLTLLRFLSDPDFWMDWSSYNLELQLGLAVLGGLLAGRLLSHPNPSTCSGQVRRMKIIRINPNVLILSVFCFLYFVFWLFITKKYVFGTLQKGIERTVEYKIGKELSDRGTEGQRDTGDRGTEGQRDRGDKGRVFLSGTTAFWLNAFFDIPQVRGGVDQAAVDKDWREAVWEIREGTEVEESLKWLKDLGVSYLVVHTSTSSEFYHDFRNPEKFEGIEGLKMVYDEEGDRIYKIED